MKAAIVDRPGVLAVREVTDPVVGDYQVLCKLLFGATCTGTDTHIIRGEFPFPVKYPVLLGHESVGVVVELGKKVKSYRVGDLVTRVGAPAAQDGSYSIAWGGYAGLGLAVDHWAMRADGLPRSSWSRGRTNQILPPSIDPRSAPMFTTWRETLSYITRIGVEPTSRVLVIGTGGNGLSFAAHAVNLGAACVWVVGSALREGLVSAMAASGFVDYRRENCVEALQAACPLGFDVIIEAVGKQGQADRYLPLLADGGTLGIYGIDDYGSLSVTPRLARGTFRVWGGGYDEAETHQRVTEFFLQGKLDSSLWYDAENPFPLTRIQEAFEHVWAKKSPKALVELAS